MTNCILSFNQMFFSVLVPCHTELECVILVVSLDKTAVENTLGFN